MCKYEKCRQKPLMPSHHTLRHDSCVVHNSHFFQIPETFPWCREWVKAVLHCLCQKEAIAPPDQPIHSLQALKYLRPRHTMRKIAATRRRDRLLQIIVAAICRTNSNWFEFVRHIAATKQGQATCCSNSADEATCRSDVSLRFVTSCVSAFRDAGIENC